MPLGLGGGGGVGVGGGLLGLSDLLGGRWLGLPDFSRRDESSFLSTLSPDFCSDSTGIAVTAPGGDPAPLFAGSDFDPEIGAAGAGSGDAVGTANAPGGVTSSWPVAFARRLLCRYMLDAMTMTPTTPVASNLHVLVRS